MRRNQPTQSSFSWLKIGLIVMIIIIIGVFIYFFITYNNIQKTKSAGFTDSEKLVLETTDIVHIDHIERFQELDQYHIVYGKTADDIEQIAFVPVSNNDAKVKVLNRSDTISEDEVRENWSSTCEQCKLVAIKPAILKDTPLWELTYLDTSNRYVFDYVSFQDGSQFEQIRLQRKFK